MRILVAASGSYGDIHPFLAISRELKSRGHDVLFFTGSYFHNAAREAGVPMVGIGPAEAYEAAVQNPEAFHPRKGLAVIANAVLEHLPEAYRRLDEAVLPGETITIGSTLSFANRLLREKRGVPTATVHLAPSIFRSNEDPPQMAEKALPGWFPPTLMRFIWWIGDRFFVDPVFCPTLNRFRAELGLPPVTRLFETWIHEGDVLVGLFPDWFATPPSDWPPKVKLTSFPLYDAGTSVELPRDVEHFLEAGSRPVVFTAGSAAAWEAPFFEKSVEACRLAGKRGVLLTRYRQQIPSALPDGVAHFPYVPFSRILPRAEALVHHGGIGTVSQALAAGTPQLVRPLAFDQFDNARRVSRLGAGRTLSSKDYRAETVAAALCSLEDHEVRAATSRAVRLLDGVDGAADTCDLILKVLR